MKISNCCLLNHSHIWNILCEFCERHSDRKIFILFNRARPSCILYFNEILHYSSREVTFPSAFRKTGFSRLLKNTKRNRMWVVISIRKQNNLREVVYCDLCCFEASLFKVGRVEHSELLILSLMIVVGNYSPNFETQIIKIPLLFLITLYYLDESIMADTIRIKPNSILSSKHPRKPDWWYY